MTESMKTNKCKACGNTQYELLEETVGERPNFLKARCIACHTTVNLKNRLTKLTPAGKTIMFSSSEMNQAVTAMFMGRLS